MICNPNCRCRLKRAGTTQYSRRFWRFSMNNGFKALLGAAILSCVMVGCESTQQRDCDTMACSTSQCEGQCEGACDGKCEGKDAKVCKDGCTKQCCAEKQACAHPNSTFSCPNCKDGKHCCAGCAAKDAAACPDCKADAHAMACQGCKDGTKCAKCSA